MKRGESSKQEVWKEKKKDIFWAIFQILETTAFCNKSLFHSMIYKLQRGYIAFNFKHTKEPPMKKDSTFS